MKVTHVITDLIVGGAQIMLRELLRNMNKAEFENEVIVLKDAGTLAPELEALGVPVTTIGMRATPRPTDLMRLASRLRQSRPDVVQTWLYQADLVGGLAARLAGVRAVVWGIHNSFLDADAKRSTVWNVKACSRLSHYVPRKIICCAEASRQLHVEMGYAAEKMIVIPNGFDLDKFKPDAVTRAHVRQELGIDESVPLIGLIGRYHPQKDHQNFVRAATLVKERVPEAVFVLCGDGSVWENAELATWIKEASLQDSFRLIGRRADTPRLYAALDILALSSTSEAFPMVIGEAMACGVPCAVTDVGDAALMVGDTGRVVPVKNPRALADALCELIVAGAEVRHTLGATARRQIETRYDIRSVATRYESVYRESGGLAHGRE